MGVLGDIFKILRIYASRQKEPAVTKLNRSARQWPCLSGISKLSLAKIANIYLIIKYFEYNIQIYIIKIAKNNNYQDT